MELSDWLRHSCEKHAVSAKAQTACVPRQWLPFRPHTPSLTNPTDAASRYYNNHVSGHDASPQIRPRVRIPTKPQLPGPTYASGTQNCFAGNNCANRPTKKKRPTDW